MQSYTNFTNLKKKYPNEWVLLGNPKMEDTLILGGIVLFHSKDKKEVCYMGRDKVADFKTVTITFVEKIEAHRKIGILKRI